MAYISTGDVRGMLGGKNPAQPILDNLKILQEQAAPKKGFLEKGLDFFKDVGEKLVGGLPSGAKDAAKQAAARMGNDYVEPKAPKAAEFMGMSPILLLGGAALVAFLVLKKK